MISMNEAHHKYGNMHQVNAISPTPMFLPGRIIITSIASLY
jgi:hypothetical protein